VREIDWETRIAKAENRFQKARWQKRQEIAQQVKQARDERNTGTVAATA
jgi:selenophosphate synthetase-related protein